MSTLRMVKGVLRTAGILIAVYVIVAATIYFRQRSLLFFPTHTVGSSGLSPWLYGDRTIGFCREVSNPRTIWLMMHGNAGQAANRDYVLQRMSEKDSLYVLEYPGYGSREGKPSSESMNQAASEAYRLLRSRNPSVPVCVLGESIGSGPACVLAGEKVAPDKILLVVPFDSLARVAARHFPFLPMRIMLHDAWNNTESLSHYGGPVQIFGAIDDTIIPIEHAQALARQVPRAQFKAIKGGHNDWSEDEQVEIE